MKSIIPFVLSSLLLPAWVEAKVTTEAYERAQKARDLCESSDPATQRLGVEAYLEVIPEIIGSPDSAAAALGYLAKCAWELGDFGRARAAWEELLALPARGLKGEDLTFLKAQQAKAQEGLAGLGRFRLTCLAEPAAVALYPEGSAQARVLTDCSQKIDHILPVGRYRLVISLDGGKVVETIELAAGSNQVYTHQTVLPVTIQGEGAQPLPPPPRSSVPFILMTVGAASFAIATARGSEADDIPDEVVALSVAGGVAALVGIVCQLKQK